MKKHPIYIIVAVDEKNGIGKGGKLPWHFKSDMAFFKDVTTRTSDPSKKNTVIMGRKTWESLPVKFRPLPDRENRVVTHSLDYGALGARTCTSLEKSLSEIGENIEKIFIIGGAEIFKQAMPIADRLYITHFNAEDKEANVFFPEIIPIVWNEVSHQEYKKDEHNPLDYTFSVYEKF